MALPKTKENWSRPSSTPAQTASQIVVAIAAVASFLAQSKDHPRLAWGLVVLAVFVLFWVNKTLVPDPLANWRKADLAKVRINSN